MPLMCTPHLTCVDKRVCCNFRGMVQCYGQMLHIAVTLPSNFLYVVTSSQTALVTCRSYTMMLHYMFVLTLRIHSGASFCHTLENRLWSLYSGYSSWKMLPFQLLFHSGVKEEIIGNQIRTVGWLWYHFDFSLLHYTRYEAMHCSDAIFLFFNEVWSFFEYVILHQLLQDCDIILRIDGGFH